MKGMHALRMCKILRPLPLITFVHGTVRAVPLVGVAIRALVQGRAKMASSNIVITAVQVSQHKVYSSPLAQKC